MSDGRRGISRRAVLAGTVLGGTALSAAPARALTASRTAAAVPASRTAAAVARSYTSGGHTVVAEPLANADGTNPLLQIRDVNRAGQVLGLIETDDGVTQQWLPAIWADGRVTVLPSPVEGAYCSATRLNDRCQAVGQYTLAGRSHATVWTDGVPRVLDIGTNYSEATALDNAGRVAVRGFDTQGGDTATWNTVCLVDGTTVTAIDARSGAALRAQAVNDRGEVLVTTFVPQGGPKGAFLWHDGAVVADFSTLDGYRGLQGVAGLNVAGDVAGDYSSPYGGPDPRGFMWSGGTLTTFTGPGDGTASLSDPEGWRVLNDAGDVVGASSTPGARRPFLWSHGEVTDLGTLGGTNAYPVGVNNGRQVTGVSMLADGSYSIFLWRAGEMIAVTPPPGFADMSVNAITEQGALLGSATTADRSRTVYFRYTVL